MSRVEILKLAWQDILKVNRLKKSMVEFSNVISDFRSETGVDLFPAFIQYLEDARELSK